MLGNKQIVEFVIRDNQIFYVDRPMDYNTIYRTNMDGTSTTQITYAQSRDTNISGNWVYYTNLKDNRRIYRTNLDGELYSLNSYDTPYGEMLGIKNQITEKISEDHSLGGLNVYDNWIYYVNESDNYKIYKIKTDGTERTKLNDRSSADINIVNGWLYENYTITSIYYHYFTESIGVFNTALLDFQRPSFTVAFSAVTSHYFHISA